MKQTPACAVALVALLAAPGFAEVPNTDCGNYERGTEIVGNIAKRFYQRSDEETSLVFRVLLGMRKDASDAKLLEEAALKALESETRNQETRGNDDSGGQDERTTTRYSQSRRRTAPTRGSGQDPNRTDGRKADRCSARRASLQKLIGLVDDEIKAIDSALDTCKADFRAKGAAENCRDSATKAMDLDYKIGLDEQGATVGPQDGELIRFMAGLEKDGCEDPGTWEVQKQVHAKIAPRPCAREGSYCYATRIGKLRQAREHLNKVAAAPLADLARSVNRPLLKEAEHRFWYLRDHPETDNRELFEGVARLTQGLLTLESGLGSCGGQ